jgi:hypothetical protein
MKMHQILVIIYLVSFISFPFDLLTIIIFTEIFHPRVLRGSAVFPDLSSHTFTAAEKYHFLDEVVPSLQSTNKKSFRGICRMYSINEETGKAWKRKRDCGYKLQDQEGRPPAVDYNSKIVIREEVEEATKEGNPYSTAQINDLIRKKAEETSADRNSSTTEITDRTVKKVRLDCNLKKRKVQKITNARWIACSDPSMSYSMYLMLKSFAEGICPQLFWNWDFTQFVYDHTETQECWIVADRADKRSINKNCCDGLPLAIKYMHLCSADGEPGPMCLLIAVSGMNDEDFVIKEVPGLSQLNTSSSVGYLIFCSSRCGNDNIYRWFLENIVMNTIQRTRNTYKLYVS